MGNTRDALRLIMGQLKDIDQAIEFCKTYDDPELWEQLIGYSLAKPGIPKSNYYSDGILRNFLISTEFVNVLLRNIGTHVDPRLLIQRIEYGVEVASETITLHNWVSDNLSLVFRYLAYVIRWSKFCMTTICRCVF